MFSKHVILNVLILITLFTSSQQFFEIFFIKVTITANNFLQFY